MSMMNAKIPYISAALLAGGVMFSPFVSACCPSDGNGQPKAITGLGQAFPVAADLASDPAWQVYEFERNGIRYTQINDATGIVRAAVGRIDDILWVMPIGRDADRVSLSDDNPPIGQARVLYRAEDVEVVLVQSGATQNWVIRAP